jgi:hypothetical protein
LLSSTLTGYILTAKYLLKCIVLSLENIEYISNVLSSIFT